MRAYLLYGTPCLHTRTPKINNMAYQFSASVEEVMSPFKQIFNFGLIFFFIPIINYDLLLLVATMVFGGPSLILDKEFSPPEDIPDYKDRIYSGDCSNL
jgi:hypothetical protein